MRNLWDTLQSSTSLPFFLLQFHALPSLSFFSSIEAFCLSFLSKAISWWWSFSFHGLFSSRWHLLSPLLLYLSLQLHGWRSPFKYISEAQRSSLHRSFSSKPQLEVTLKEKEIHDEFPNESLLIVREHPWFANIENFKEVGVIPNDLNWH